MTQYDSLTDYAEQLIEDCYADSFKGLWECVRYYIDYQGIFDLVHLSSLKSSKRVLILLSNSKMIFSEITRARSGFGSRFGCCNMTTSFRELMVKNYDRLFWFEIEPINGMSGDSVGIIQPEGL